MSAILTLMQKPQLAQTIQSLDDLPLPRDRYVMQPKLDGHRLLAKIRRHGGVTYYSRSGEIIDDTHLGHITKVLQKFPADTILDGELWHPGGFGAVASGIAGTLSHELTYEVFDVLQFAGHNARSVSLNVRRKLYEDILVKLLIESVRPIVQVPVSEKNYECFIDAGLEGAVIKRIDSPYRNGQRTDWFKLKPYQSDEMRVEIIEQADPGLRFIDYKGRKCYSPKAEARKVQLGDIIEVRHDGITDEGKFRNPRFERIRTDLRG